MGTLVSSASITQQRMAPASLRWQMIRDINRDLAIVELRTVDAQIEAALAQRGGPAILLTLISVLGLLLSAIGLYGVVSYGVRDRAREFGIRLALGARPASVRRLALRRGLSIIAMGMLLGGAAAIGITQVLRGVLFGVGPQDPLTLAAVCGILLTTACVALYLPARWASRLDPAHTLRSE